MRNLFTLIVTAVLLASCADSSSPVFVTNTCHVDVPPREAVVAANAPLNFGGWAFDGKAGLSPARVRVQFVSSDRRTVKTFDAKRGTKRPDVVKAHNAPGAEDSGFDGSIAAGSLAPGTYDVIVLQELSSGVLVCANVYAISVK